LLWWQIAFRKRRPQLLAKIAPLGSKTLQVPVKNVIIFRIFQSKISCKSCSIFFRNFRDTPSQISVKNAKTSSPITCKSCSILFCVTPFFKKNKLLCHSNLPFNQVFSCYTHIYINTVRSF